MLDVAIGIPTFRRPDKLATLLAELPARIAEVGLDRPVRILVVDNDPSGSARAVAQAAGPGVEYAIEPTPGIAAVRNRLMDEAEGSRLLAFIDDDERPLDHWLSSLVGTWVTHGSAAVMGRVISVFPDEVDPWLLGTGVFRRRERPTGLEIPVAAAGNLLLDLDQIRSLGIRFDTSLGLAGGEDTLFSRMLVAAGGRIVWCNESRAEDDVPAERLTRQWAMRRAYNGGNLAVDNDLRLEASAVRRQAIRVRRLIGGLVRASLGWLRHAWGRLRGDLEDDARGMRTAYRGWGMANGALGRRHLEYTRP
ncbi:glycosyltransferase family 2 protein [Microbacterium sp. M]|uniref:glycosyltransferase family 2 protein n=1 Tax=Microbacterium sp. M TaxID=3377125 RepID=UPI003863F8C3